MTRVKNNVVSRLRHKKIIKQAKGYYSARSRTYRAAFQAVTKANQYSYRDRRQKKRQFRKLWITRISAAAKLHGISYSKLINDLKSSSIKLNRKILANIAILDQKTFTSLVNFSKNKIM